LDLSRAKNILIIVFLALNSILVYQLYLKQQGDNDYTALMEAEIQEVRELLNSQMINLNEEIPIETPELPFLNAERILVNSLEIRNNMLVKDEDIVISIEPGEGISYNWISNDAMHIKAYNIENGVDDFARQYLYKGRNYTLHQERLQKNSGQIVYLQAFNGYPIFGLSATANVDNNRVVNWQQNIVEEIKAEDTDRPILAAATALRSLPSKIEERPATIESILLGYYNRSMEAESWLLPPVWGVTLDSGEQFYINAFTGELEGLQEQIED